MNVSQRCACGGIVTADPDDPAAGVRAHQDSAEHVAWRSPNLDAVILGPCGCHRCGRYLVWNGFIWRQLDGLRHDCRAAVAA